MKDHISYEQSVAIARIKAVHNTDGMLQDFKIVTCNAAFLALANIRGKQPQDESVFQLIRAQNFEDSLWEKSLMQVFEGEKWIGFEQFLATPSKWFKTHIFWTDDELIEVQMTDISEFKALLWETNDTIAKQKAIIDLHVSILSSQTEMICRFLPDSTLVFVNEAYSQALKMPSQTLIGRKFIDFLPISLKSDITMLLQHVQQYLVSTTRVYKTKDTLDTWQEWTIHPILDNDSALIAFQALGRDITSQKSANDSILRHNSFQKMVAEISTDFVRTAISDLDFSIMSALTKMGLFFDADRSYIFEYDHNARTMSNTYEWCANGIQNFKDALQKIPYDSVSWWTQKMLNNEVINLTDVELVPEIASGERKLLHEQHIKSLLCVPIANDNQVYGFFGFDSVREHRNFLEHEVMQIKVLANILADIIQRGDIERQIRTQNEMQNILSRIAMHYINLPTSKLVSSISESLAELARFTGADRAYIFDYDWENDVCNNTYEWCEEGISPQINELQNIPLQMLPQWVDHHKSGNTMYIKDVFALDPEDGVRQILEPQEVKSLIALPMINSGQCIGFVGFDSVRKHHIYTEREQTLLQLFSQLLVNVSNRITLENNLISEKEKAEAASKAKSEFLANMSHEIRTPLNGVIGFTELLINSKLNSNQQQYAQNIISSSYNLLGIINDILDFSKIEAGKLELDMVKTDIIQLIEHAADIIKVKTAQKSLELLVDIAPDFPRYAVVDPLRLNQILINLLSNAEKFTQKGEIILQAKFKMQDADHALISFSVSDTGIGISAKDRKALFRAFSQVDNSTTRKYGGTGLGLVISNHLANMMRSRIELESEPGKGSRFYFDLVLRVEFGDKTELGNFDRIKKILMIDDNDSNRMILEHTVQHWGLDFTGVDNGISGIEAIKQSGPFDVIIVDYNMPYLNGINTIKMIKTHTPESFTKDSVILLHSSSDDATILAECRLLGIHYRLVKPIKTSELRQYLLRIDSNQLSFEAEPIQDTEAKSTRLEVNFKPRILIAEDNKLNLALLKEMIGQSLPDAEIYEAYDGYEALQSIKDYQPHVVLMDIQMPNLDGLSATRKLREFSDVPVIAITAGALQEEKDKCLQAGMNAFVTKPVLASELSEVLNTFLQNSVVKTPITSTPAKTPDIHFNREALLDNLSQDNSTLNSLLHLVQESIPEKLEELRQALEASDIAETKAILHSLRGSAQNMYFVFLGELTSKLEYNIETLSQDEISKLASDIEAEWLIVKSML